MKLLVFSPYYPPHIGGLETHSDEFNKYLSQEGVDITVFTPRLPSDASEIETCHHTVQVIRFPACELIHNYPIPKFWLPKFWQLLTQASNSKPDIIISRTRFFSTSLFALAYAKIKRVPLVHIEHGSDFAQFNGAFKTFLGKIYDCTLGRIVLRYSNTVIANSQASARFVAKLSGRKDCVVIYRGVETENILNIPIDTELKKIYAEKTIIGFIGRLIDGKGVSDLLSTLSLLQRNDFVCFIVGSGPELKKLESLVQQKHLHNQVIFFGHQPRDKALSIMKTCDIIINPSYTEGLPTSVIEAALNQKAIIATNVGGTSEIITGSDDGFLIESKSIHLLKETLETFLSNPNLQQTYGKKAFQKVSEKFSWPQSVNRYMEIFRNLLNS